MPQIVETPEQQRLRREREAAATALYRARGLDPNRAALAGEAASVLGLPPIVVQENEDLINQARQEREMQTLSDHHRTIRWIAQPGNAEIAHDQVDSLTGIEAMAQRRPRFVSPDAAIGQTYRSPDAMLTQQDNDRALGIVRRFPGGAIEGVGRAAEGLYTTELRILDRLGLNDTPYADFRRSQRDASRRVILGGQNLGGTLSAADQARGRAAGQNVLRQTTVDTGLAGDISGGLGQVVSQAAIAIGSGGAATLPSLFGQGVSAMDERVRADQQKDGRTEYSVADDMVLLGGGAVTALSEKLGLDAILGRLPKPVRERLTSRLIDVFVAGAVEGSSEVAEGVGQNALAISLLGEDSGLLDGAVQGGSVGAAVGSIARALVLTAIPGRQHIRDQVRSDIADASATNFDQMVEAANANELRKRSPEQFRDFLNQVNEGDTVFIPAEAAVTFFQSNPDLQEWIDEWDIRDQYEAALASGADIAIPTGDYLARVGPTEAHAAWRDDLRHGLEAMSVKEAAAFREGGEAALNEQLDAAVDGAATPDASQAVFDDWVRQARGAGFTVDVANTQAALVAQAFSQRAARSGGRFADALAAYRDANLSIRQELPDSVRQRMDQTDVLIEALRQARKPEGQQAMFGRSLAEFVSQEGGVLDTGGELAAMGADQWHRNRRVGTRRLIRARAETGNSAYETDAVAQRAVEAGYLPEGSTGNDLLQAIREEVAGRPRFSQSFERDSVTEANRQAVNDLEVLLGQLGIDVNTATNAEIKAALDGVANAPVSKGQTFDQNEGTKRGQVALSPEARTITLFKGRDLSTFFHEFGHVTLDLLSRDADLSPEARADLDIALKYLGADSVEAIGVDQHELWARSFENYLMEGKAPSADLRSVFRTIKSWMVSIYRTALNLRAPLSDEIRGVFDRLLASDEEIAAATRDLALDAELSEIERETMTPQQQAEYGRLMNSARSQAETAMLDRMMRAIRKERTAEWNAWADDIRPRVTEEIDAQPDIRALQWMRGQNVGLDRAEVIRLLGDEAGLSLLPKGIPPIVRKSGGVHPDSVAEAAGYSSGREMLNGLMDHEAERRQMREVGDNRTVRAKRIDAQIKTDLLELYGDPLENGSIEAEAMAAVHGERMDRAVAARWGVVARSANLPPPPPISAMRQWAAEKIGSRTVREAKSGKYLRAERKAATAAEKALKAGNKVEAARQMQARTINRLLYSEARKAEEYAGVAVRRLSRLDNARTIKSMDQDYLEQIQAILEQYDFRQASARQVQRRITLAEFIAQKAEEGQEITVPPDLASAAGKTHYSQLTVDELRALDTTVRALAKLGRLKRELKFRGEKRSLAQVADMAVASAAHLPTVYAPDGFRKEDGRAAALMDTLVQFEASLVKAQEWFRLLDGGDPAGVFASALDIPANEAFVRLQELEAGFFEPVIAAEGSIPKAVKNGWMDVVNDHPFLNPETGGRLENVRRRDLLAAALQTGNMSNFEIMAKGWGMIPRDADPIAIAAARTDFVAWLDTKLDATEWAYVQAWWDGFERNKADYFATARELNGYAPEAIDAEPIQTSAGELAGGYVPVSYDSRFDQLQRERDQADGSDIFGGLNRSGPRPDSGSTKERTGYSGPVALDLDRIASGARKHARYIAYGQYVENSLKFIRQPMINRTIRDKLGEGVPKAMENWIAAQVKTDAVLDPNANAFVKVARWSRTNMTAALLLGSVNVLMAQPGGLLVSASTLGPARLAGGMIKSAALMASGRFNDFVFSRSAIMRDRFEGAGLDRDIRLALTRNKGKRSKVEMARYLAGRAIAAVDVYVVSGPTWIAAYDQALAEGREETEAAYIADKAAEASQGSGRASTLSAIQQNSEVTKMVTFAYGWANALYNVQRGSLADIRNGVNQMNAVAQLAMVSILPPLADALLSGDLPDWEDEDGELAAIIKWFARNVFFGAFSGIPIVRDFAGAGERKAAGKYAGPVGQTPLGRIGDEVFKLGQDVWDLSNVVAVEATNGAIGDPNAEVSGRWPAHFINTLGFALGLPGTAQASRSTNYLTDTAEGEQNPDGLLDWIVGLTRGPQENQE